MTQITESQLFEMLGRLYAENTALRVQIATQAQTPPPPESAGKKPSPTT